MIILDTNVISDVMSPNPNTRVLTWLAMQPSQELYTTAIAQAEILHGIRILPEGRRRTDLERVALAIFNEDMAGKVLPFDTRAAGQYAKVAAARRSLGRPISAFDAQIAAIAITHNYQVATRNTADFEGFGLNIINPWTIEA